MAFGRPREYDRDQIALDMIKWAQKEDSLNLNGFCAINLIAPSKISQWAREEDHFRLSYEITKAILAERREKSLSDDKLHVKAYDLNACTYDHFLKETKMELAKFESMLKLADLENLSPEYISKIEQMMAQMRGNQASNSDLTSKSAEVKS